MRVLHLASNDENQPIFALAFTHKPADFADIAKGLKDGIHYVEAAEVKAPRLDDGFFLTNTIEHEWFNSNKDCVVPTKASLRSTSAGDIIIQDDEVFLVANCGFEKLAIKPAEVKLG